MIRAVVVAAAAAVLATATAGCTDDEGSTGSFCEEIREAPPLASLLTGFADQEPSQLERRLDEARAEYGDLRTTAPGEIEPDVDKTVDLVDALISAIRANGTDPVAAAAAVRDVVDEHPDAATSGLAVADYAKQKCQVELNPTVETGDDPATTTVAEGEDGAVEGGM